VCCTVRELGWIRLVGKGDILRTTLTGLYPDSPMPSIARQRYSPAFYKPVTFIAFLNPISENTDSSAGFPL
jgi:hypothetical protein